MDQMDSIDQTASCMVSASAFFEIRILRFTICYIIQTNKQRYVIELGFSFV